MSPPAPAPGAASRCAALHRELPGKLADSYRARSVTPSSPLTAAWGSPAIVLTCGVPGVRRPLAGNEFTVNGVTWLEDQEGNVRSWWTLDRPVTVELDVPNSYDDQDAVVADVSGAVAKALPRGSDNS